MKKGLLTLLAAALTIVGCQDYDSQFKELTTLVTNLAMVPNTPVGSVPFVSQASDGIGLDTLFKLLVKAE